METVAELAALRKSLNRGAYYGDAKWQKMTARSLGLESSMRLRGWHVLEKSGREMATGFWGGGLRVLLAASPLR